MTIIFRIVTENRRKQLTPGFLPVLSNHRLALLYSVPYACIISHFSHGADMKMSSYQYKNSHCGDKMTVLSPQWDFLYWKTTSLYWIRALVVITSNLQYANCTARVKLNYQKWMLWLFDEDRYIRSCNKWVPIADHAMRHFTELILQMVYELMIENSRNKQITKTSKTRSYQIRLRFCTCNDTCVNICPNETIGILIRIKIIFARWIMSS